MQDLGVARRPKSRKLPRRPVEDVESERCADQQRALARFEQRAGRLAAQRRRVVRIMLPDLEGS
ncbi:MAG: hypothetical protein SNJ62_06110, partial [Chloracidobacterium sp.]